VPWELKSGFQGRLGRLLCLGKPRYYITLPMTTDDLLAAALAHQRAGRLDQAAALYDTILADRPAQPDALHFSALIALQRGDKENAVARLALAAAAAPERAVIHNDLGAALRLAGRLPEAAAALEQATSLDPSYADAWNNLGFVRRAMSDFRGARDALERATNLRPGFAPTWNALGVVLKALGEADAALAAFQKAIGLKSDYVEALTNLGLALHERGDAAALVPLRRAVELAPGLGEAWLNLGLAQRAAHDLEEAVASLRRSVAANPALGAAWNALGVLLARQVDERHAACEALARAADCEPYSADILSNYGLSLNKVGRNEEALAVLERALAVDPRHGEALFNRGIVRQQEGDFDGAFADWKAAVSADPQHRDARSNLIFSLQYEEAVDASDLLAAAREYDRLHGHPKERYTSWTNERAPDRRLRIGYVSPDFRTHSVAHYMEPLLTAHDRAAVEIFAYAQVPRPDHVTARLQALVPNWRFTNGVGGHAMARLIREDAIDILVDLAGHSAGNRLAVFALKPAPVQVTWLGFPGTTGLSAIDYRVTDEVADPPGAEAHSSETLMRLPRGFHCWRPPAATPSTLREERAPLTFGSFNNVQKISADTVALWSAILQRVPEARLSLKSNWLSRPRAVDTLRRAFAAHGVQSERLLMSAFVPDTAAHLAAYGGVDVALDPHPYNGTTTTLEALWMGVPVISLLGNRHAARVGASLLGQIGARDLIADSVDSYIDKAVALIRDRHRLVALRQQLRGRLAASPLMDAAGFARALETAYRTMWQRWCDASN
jgi:protein O-GlcNAc transferase